VTLSKTASKYRTELRAMAEGLPFKEIELPEYRRANYRPESIRQKRTYLQPEHEMQAIGRFLIERGTVGILSPEQTLALFKEIHWCAYRIRRLARRRYRSTSAVRRAVVDARKLISRIEAAEEELFIANRRLVVSCVKPFFWIGQVWLADFLQEGSKALSNAVRKFDFTRGTPFYAYAQKAIQNRLRNYFRDHVRAGSIAIHPTREMSLLKTASDKWKEQHDREPDDEELSRVSGLSPERIHKIRPFLRQWERIPAPALSLDAAFGDENDSNLYQFISDSEAPDAPDAAQRAEIWDAIDRLPPRMRYIMYLRFLEGHTLEETGRRLNLTRARIKQIEDDALRKLRHMFRRDGAPLKRRR